MLDLDNQLFKPEWMRPPNYRWALITHQLANPKVPVKEITKDSCLIEGAKFYEYRRKNKNAPAEYLKRFPVLSLSHDLFLSNKFGGWRWYLEALLMTSLTDEEIATALKIKVSPAVIRMYRKLFFDISAYQQSDVAVMANVLSISKQSANVTDCDFSWKYFAYVWGADKFLEQFTCKRPNTFDNSVRRWFKDLARDNISVQSFQITADMRQMYSEDAREILKLAKEYYQITEEDTNKVSDSIFKDNLSDALNNVHLSIASAPEVNGIDKRPGSTLDILDFPKEGIA